MKNLEYYHFIHVRIIYRIHFQNRITVSKRKYLLKTFLYCFNYLKTTESCGQWEWSVWWNCADKPRFGLVSNTPLSCGFEQVTLPLMVPRCTPLQKLETSLYLSWRIIKLDEIMDGKSQHCSPFMVLWLSTWKWPQPWCQYIKLTCFYFLIIIP